MVSYILTFSSILVFCFILRGIPVFRHKNIGVDHWFWKGYIEKYRQEKKFPPDLPQYILDEHQWYPPLFPLLMSYLPKVIFEKYNAFFAIFIDIVRFIILISFSAFFLGREILCLIIVGFTYVTTPILISYNVQLNPRGLGALFLDLTILLLLYLYSFPTTMWLWFLIILLSSFILLTHKMTTQLFWFLCLVGSVFTKEWTLLALIPASISTALIISKGFYWKVLKAHWDIVSFWSRNWRWIQAHPLKESPVYGDSGYETPSKLHLKGLNGVLKHARYLFAYYPVGWVLVLTVVFFNKFCNEFTFCIWIMLWFFLILTFSLITVYIPVFKCLGSGYYYLYNLASPGALLWGIYIGYGNNPFLLTVWFFGIILNLIALFKYYDMLKLSVTQIVDDYFNELLVFLSKMPRGVVMCFPPQWYDVVAYKTGHPVLFGGHGYGFRLLEPVFPRLTMKFDEIKKKYDVRYLVSLEGYLNERFLNDLEYTICYKFGKYMLYVI